MLRCSIILLLIPILQLFLLRHFPIHIILRWLHFILILRLCIILILIHWLISLNILRNRLLSIKRSLCLSCCSIPFPLLGILLFLNFIGIAIEKEIDTFF